MSSRVPRGALIVTMIATATAFAVSSPASAASSATANEAAANEYVALGDSYTSAPLVLPIAPGAPLDCEQSAVNYPHLVAKALGVSPHGVSLHDVSCGGATVSNMTQAQSPDQPPQFDALTQDTSIVTLGIGGNDDSTFETAVAGCGALDVGDVIDYGAPCQAAFGSSFAEHIAADAPNIAAALRRIHQLSPNARVFVVGYPDILPQQGNCYPRMPLTTGDVRYLNGVERDLNGMLRQQAASNGATFVDTYDVSIGHDACQPEGTRWVEPMVPSTDAISVHPNAAGESAMAKRVEAAID
ncbi:MAG: SGNH/GDSL hydrolase family protein [Sciscionella sp.]|nr:SGNH/GDSL hydrolase family protein [Sciscionella sp.]